MTAKRFATTIAIAGGVGVVAAIAWKVIQRAEAERKTDELAENDRMLEEFDYRMSAPKRAYQPLAKRRKTKANAS